MSADKLASELQNILLKRIQSDQLVVPTIPAVVQKVQDVLREGDQAVRTARGAIRVPTVIVAVNYAKVPKKRPKLCAKAIRERDGNRCQYTGRLLHPNEGSLDHVVPRSRGGADSWENLVWSAKDVNQRKADRLPHEASLKLLNVPRAPKELPVTALLRNIHGLTEWKLFLNE